MSEMKHTPNPLPCGCGVMGRAGFNAEGTLVEYKGLHIKFCPKHAAAPELYEALEKLLAVDDAWHGSVNSEMADARQKARAALRKVRAT